ncbi:MAG: hypothetical protein ACXVEF_22900 [Polyangiales bacterium]
MELRGRGLGDKYFEVIEPEHRETMRSIVAGGWTPLAVGMAHYAACDRLDLSHEQQFAMGHEVGARIQQSLLGTLVRLAKESGATPWTFFSNIERLWERMMRGSAIGVWETGPKDARIELHQCPIVRHAYCRNAMRGIIAGMAEQVARRVYVNEVRDQTSDVRFVANVSWA